MAEFARSVEVGEVASHLAARVAGVVDDEFRRHCRVGGLRSGTLKIFVGEASLVWAMRTKWATPLQQALNGMTGAGRSVKGTKDHSVFLWRFSITWL